MIKPRCRWERCLEEPIEGYDYCAEHEKQGVARDELAKALRWATHEAPPVKQPNTRAKLHATLNKAIADGKITSPVDYLNALQLIKDIVKALPHPYRRKKNERASPEELHALGNATRAEHPEWFPKCAKCGTSIYTTKGVTITCP